MLLWVMYAGVFSLLSSNLQGFFLKLKKNYEQNCIGMPFRRALWKNSCPKYLEAVEKARCRSHLFGGPQLEHSLHSQD